MNINDLDRKDDLLLISNVWDVPSAIVAKNLGFKALGTSSGAMATMLGYADGEEMSFAELEYLVRRIRSNIDLPLSVDLEAGYSRKPAQIVEYIKRLSDLGVSRINIEDSVVNGKRSILSEDEFCKTLSAISNTLAQSNIEMFLNVRTDPFLLELTKPLEQAIQRSNKYAQEGADGIFIPCMEKEEDIVAFLKHCSLPLNVMCLPNLPNFERLKKLGVSRISMGNFVYSKLNQHLEEELRDILSNQSFQSIFN